MMPESPEPAQTIPNASPLRFTNHSGMNKMDGLYAIQPPKPKAMPCDRTRWVTFVAKEPMASDRLMMTSPIVENQRVMLGSRIIATIVNGQLR